MEVARRLLAVDTNLVHVVVRDHVARGVGLRGAVHPIRGSDRNDRTVAALHELVVRDLVVSSRIAEQHAVATNLFECAAIDVDRGRIYNFNGGTPVNGPILQNAMTSSEECTSAEAEGYRIKRSLMD